MTEFFARLYEWFGWIHFYSRDYAEHLRGWDYACIGYFATPWYFYIGLLMLITTIVIFGLRFDIISVKRFHEQKHWWLVGFTVFVVNFFLAFVAPLTTLMSGAYCHRLGISIIDVLGFGLSNGIWSFIFFVMLSFIPVIVRSILKR